MTEFTLSIKPSYHLVWLFALLEILTVPLLALTSQYQSAIGELKSSWHGFIIGYVGVFLLFILLNQLLKGAIKLRLFSLEINKIQAVSMIALWGGIILFSLFALQKLLFLVIPSTMLGLFVVGFIATSASLFITAYVYNLLSTSFLTTAIKLTTPLGSFYLKSISVGPLAFYAGCYEAVALPIINLWQYSHPSQQVIMGAITGALGGSIGAISVIFIYPFFKKFPIQLTWRQMA